MACSASRTAAGTVDTSASQGKADKIVEGLSGADAAKHATDNFERTIRSVYQHRNDKFTPESIGKFADNVNRSINKGQTRNRPVSSPARNE